MHNNLTVCIMAAYYNPRCRNKIKDGVLVHRERGTTGGAQIDIDCKTAAYTSSMQIFALDHLPLYDRKCLKRPTQFEMLAVRSYYCPAIHKPSKYGACVQYDEVEDDTQDGGKTCIY
jgi:hypothetical protein